jgi:hypothetical protein
MPSYMNKKILKIYFISFLISVISFSLLVFIRGTPPKNLNTFFRMTEWSRGAYFNTNDFSNYIVGIIIFLTTPFLMKYFIKTRLFDILHKNIKFWCPPIFIILICVIYLKIFPVIVTKIPILTHLLTTKKRGSEIFTNLPYVFIFMILWIISFHLISKEKFNIMILNLYTKLSFRINNFFLKIRMMDNLSYMLVFLLIIIFIYNPKYKYSFDELAYYGGETAHQFHHVNFYLGPINEIINGKMLLVDASSQYGILSTYLPSLVFDIRVLSYSGFINYSMIVSVFYCFLFYIFLYMFTGSRKWAFLGLLAYIRIAFFRNVWTNEIYTYPSSTPLRYICDIFMFMAFYLISKKGSLINTILLSFIAALSIFYNLEIGLSLLIAFMISITFYSIYAVKRNKLKFFLLNICLLVLNLLLIGFAISIMTVVRSGFWPDWPKMIESVLFYTGGFFDIPAPIIGEYYLILAVYIYTFYYLSVNNLRKLANGTLIMFILVYGIISFIYYLGFNEPHHLYTVAHPAIILYLYHLQILIRNLSKIYKFPVIYSSLLVSSAVFITVWIISPVPATFQNIKSIFHKRYIKSYNNYKYWNYPGTGFYLADDDGSNFKKSADIIRKLSVNSKKILILSRYDTLLYAMAGKTSILNNPIMEYGIFYKDDLNKTIKIVQKKQPEYIYLFSEHYNQMKTDNIMIIWEAIRGNYIFVEKAGVVDVYRYYNKIH